MRPSDADLHARLERIQQLWEQLEHTSVRTPEYEALMRQIRADADAFKTTIKERPTRRKDDPQH